MSEEKLDMLDEALPIVIRVLQDSTETLCWYRHNEESKWENQSLEWALKRVLQHYMTKEDFDEYLNNLGD